MHNENQAEQQEKLVKLIKKFGTAMLTTRGADGNMHSRPMTPLGDEFDGGFWFATEIDNAAVIDLQANPEANVGFMHEGDNNFISVAGRGSISQDRAQIARLWSAPMNAFFKGGKDDPRVCLIRIDAQHADYWDGPGNLLTKLVFFATVATTGNHEALSDTGSVNL